MVVVDVMVTDNNGNPVTDMTAKDFEVFEHLDWIRRVPQKIASFRPVNPWDVRPIPPKKTEKVPAGVYTNQVVAGDVPVAPVIFLIEREPTNAALTGADQQMNKMIDAIPANVPVAIYSFDDGVYAVRVMQSFTLDHALLKAAAAQGFAPDPNHPHLIETRLDAPFSMVREPFGVFAGGDD
jgi:VWFA-related protein